jgi:hypothetical protein
MAGIGTTAAVIMGGAALASAGVGAAGAAGMFGGGSGSSATAFPMGAIRKTMDRYVGDVGGDVFGPEYGAAMAAMAAMDSWKTRKKKGKTEYQDPATKQWISADDYNSRRSGLNNRSLIGDVTKLGDQFTERVEGIVSAGDKQLGDREGQLESRVDGLNQKFAEGQTSLGDRFLSAVDAAKTEFDGDWEQSLSLSPERLSLFTQAADFMSQAAVDTRARMLATADPRALELSAIADENAAAMMSGRIGANMQANLARSSAMRALQGGFGASSEMGRGMTARDLGLMSLDLQRQGMNDFERQRMLNYNTRVAGLQADAGALLGDDSAARRQRALTNYEVGINVAEGDRNQRVGALNTIYGTSVGVAGDIFQTGSNRIQQNTNTLANAASSVFGENTRARLTGFQAITDARKNAAATKSMAAQNAWSAQNAVDASNQSNQNALTGNLISSGASMLGGVLGGMSGGGSTLSSLGSFMSGGLNNQTGFYGSATGASKAFGVEPSAISRSGVGQYYYNPGGVYGQ